MTDAAPPGVDYGDPLSRPFWDAARRNQLLLQRCGDCGAHQLFPRPFCVACESADVAWVQSPGIGEVYAATTVRIRIAPDLEPPYAVALVTLEEGPRLLGRVPGTDACPIGLRVRVGWADRPDLPPLPLFLPYDEE